MSDTIDTDDLLRQLTAGTPSRSYLLAIMPVVLDRLAAWEATARQIVAYSAQYQKYQGKAMCRWCENVIVTDGHRPTCPAGLLAALLTEEDA